MAEHLLFKEHLTGSYPAFTTPDKAIPVTSVTFAGTRNLDIHEDTGSTIRSRAYKSQGAVNASGTLNMRAYPEYLLPFLFRSIFTDVNVVAASSGYTTDLLPNDDTDVQLPWFSFQKKYHSSFGENVRGAVVQKITLSCTGGEVMNVAVDFVLADVTQAGQPWSGGGASSAGVVGVVPYPSSLTAASPNTLKPLRFHEGALLFGGTPSVATKKISVAGATTMGTIQSFTLEITTNAEARFSVRDGAPTIAYTRHGEREIVFTGDIDWAGYASSYYQAMLAANETAIRLEFQSDGQFPTAQNYQLYITMPRMVWPQDGAPAPQLDGVLMPKTQALKLVAMEHLTLGTDIGVTIKTLDNLT